MISQLAVADDLAEHRLVRVEVDGVDLTRVLRAVWPRDRRLAGPAAALLELATARHAGNGPQPNSCGPPGQQVS